MTTKVLGWALITLAVASPALAETPIDSAKIVRTTAMERFFARMAKIAPAGVGDLPPLAALEATFAECDRKCEINVIAFQYPDGNLQKCAVFIPVNVLKVKISGTKPQKLVFKLVNVVDKESSGDYEFMQDSGLQLRKPNANEIPSWLKGTPRDPIADGDLGQPVFESQNAKNKIKTDLLESKEGIFAYVVKVLFKPKNGQPIICDEYDPLIANQ